MHEQLARRFYRMFTTGDLTGVREVLDPAWTNHPADPGRSADVAGFLLGIDDLRTALDGLSVEFQETVEDGAVIVCRIRLAGRFVAAFAGIAPTGLPAAFDAMDLHRVRDGRIVETWHYEHLEQLVSMPV